MEFKDFFCTFHQANKLKELKVPFSSVFCYDRYGNTQKSDMFSGNATIYYAYSCSEPGEIINQYENSTEWHSWMLSGGSWNVWYVGDDGENHSIDGKTEAIARAAYLIYLMENPQE